MTISENINWIYTTLQTEIPDDHWISLAVTAILLAKFQISFNSSDLESRIKELGLSRGINLEDAPTFKEAMHSLKLINEQENLKEYKP